MALIKSTFTPGIDKQTSTYGAEGKWVDSKNVRFRTGLPEKMGGWEKVVDKLLIGVVRGMKAWISNAGVRYIAIGTERKLYVYSEGAFYDITPIRVIATNLSNPFTSNGTNRITVTDSNHGAIQGDFVTFSEATALSGNDMNQEFQISTIVNTNSYTIIYPNTVSTATGGGTSVDAAYQINVGTSISTFGFGWGVGPWNVGTWNTPRTTSTIALEATYWSLDTFGEDLLAIRNNDKLYKWDLSAGTGTRAEAIINAPTSNRFLLVSSPDRHVFLFGTETSIGTTNTRDDLFLRFSSQENPSDWNPKSTNSAGTFRIQDGSQIVSAQRSRGSILVWTDTALHSLNNIGPPFIFGLNQVGSNCGAVSPSCTADVNGTTFWMSQTAFYSFDGAIKKLNCTVQDFVFDNINSVAQQQVVAAVNTDYNEVTWFYPTAGSGFLNVSVTYNYLEGTWYTNNGFARTAWFDRGVYGNPYATDYGLLSGLGQPIRIGNATPINGVTPGAAYLYLHEKGVNDDGAAMDCQITSGDFDIQEGDQVLLTSRVIPDFKNLEGSTDITITFANYPASTNTRTFTSSVNNTTKFFSTRGRGRQANIKIASNAVDSNWRYGTLRLDIRPDGGR